MGVGKPAPSKVAESLLGFGFNTAKLLWVSAANSHRAKSSGSQFTTLAQTIQQALEQGRATAAVVRGPFNVGSAAIGLVGLTARDPKTRFVAGVAAWGAKETGDYVADKVTTYTHNEVLGILARGLHDSDMTPTELMKLTPDELSKKVQDLEIGGQKLSVALRGIPGAEQMLQAQVRNLAMNSDLATLETVKRNTGTLAEIRKKLTRTHRELTKYTQTVDNELDRVGIDLAKIRATTTDIQRQTKAVWKGVEGNAVALNDMSQIEYMGWSTSQKLAALQSGMFAGIPHRVRSHLITKLERQQMQEREVSELRSDASSMGNLATIAKNFNVDPHIVRGLQAAQIIADGIADYTDPLGAVATLSALAGLGNGGGQNSTVMAELGQINEKLNKVLKLQKQTLQAISELSQQLSSFRSEMLTKMRGIEKTALLSVSLLKSAQKQRWIDCAAIINGPMNKVPRFSSISVLEHVLHASSSSRRLNGCLHVYKDTFDAYIKGGDWDDLLVDERVFPSINLTDLEKDQRRNNQEAEKRIKMYEAARKYLLAKLASEPPGSIPGDLLRLALPVMTAPAARELAARLRSRSIHKRLTHYKCGDQELLTPGVHAILCSRHQANGSPIPDQWMTVINPVLLGPESYALIDDGLAISTLAEFAWRHAKDAPYILVSRRAVRNASIAGLSPAMRRALSERNGIRLLRRLSWLADDLVVEQSVESSGYTAELIEGDLYVPKRRALVSSVTAKSPVLQQRAFDAIKVNRRLARNVVMLALRQAFRDSKGGRLAAQELSYYQTRYFQGITDMETPDGCAGEKFTRGILNEMFPNWTFAFLRNPNDTRAAVKRCKETKGNRGTGVYAIVSGLAVRLPDPLALTYGDFQVPKGLRRAVWYRDRVMDALVDRRIGKMVKQIVKNYAGSQQGRLTSGKMDLELLNNVSG